MMIIFEMLRPVDKYRYSTFEKQKDCTQKYSERSIGFIHRVIQIKGVAKFILQAEMGHRSDIVNDFCIMYT